MKEQNKKRAERSTVLPFLHNEDLAIVSWFRFNSTDEKSSFGQRAKKRIEESDRQNIICCAAGVLFLGFS